MRRTDAWDEAKVELSRVSAQHWQRQAQELTLLRMYVRVVL